MKTLIIALITAMASVFGLRYRPASAFAGGVTPATVTPNTADIYGGADDAALLKETALNNGAGSVTSQAINIYDEPFRLGDQYFIQLRLPAFTTAELPDTRTITGTLYTASHANLDNGVALGGSMVSTGAGGVGAAAKSASFRVPPQASQYLYVIWTNGASVGNVSAKKGVLAIKAA